MATQAELAKHLDLSPRRIRGLAKDGVLPTSKGRGGYDIDSCRIAYINYLRGLSNGQIKPQATDDEEVDGNYSVMLEKERWREKKRQNDIEEGLVAPVSLLTEALEKVISQIIPIFDSLPLIIKRNWPEVTGDQVTLIKKSIAECRNAASRARIEL